MVTKCAIIFNDIKIIRILQADPKGGKHYLNDTQNARKDGRNLRYRIPIILLSVLLVAAVIAIVMLTLRGGGGRAAQLSDGTPVIIGGGEPLPDEQGKAKDVGNIHLPAFGGLTFAAGTKEQTVTLRNPGENSCLIRISLILADGTVIYTSELVEPGYSTQPITLVAPMERGLYRDVILKYECFTNDETHAPLNGATSKLDLTVQ